MSSIKPPASQGEQRPAITPVRCPAVDCHWAAFGIPDAYTEARAWHLAAHRAEEHGEPLTAEQLAFAKERGYELPALPPEREAEIREGRTAFYRTREQLDAALDDVLAELDRERQRSEKRRKRMVAAEGDLMDIRGALSPNGFPRRVPMPLGERVAPVVEWLLDERDRLEQERHTTNDKLAEAHQALRKAEAELAELRVQVEKLQGLHTCPALATNLDRCCKRPGHDGDHSSFAGRHIWSAAHAAEAARLHHCTAEYGGPGYSHCELPAGHDGQHEAAMGNMHRATWGGGE